MEGQALASENKRSPAYNYAYGGFQPSDYGQASALGPMVGMAIGASIAQEEADSSSSKKDDGFFSAIHPKKIIPGVVAGITIAVGTQLLLAYLRPKLGLDKKGK